MAQYTDEEILQANQGRISIGEYVVFKGNLLIKWASQDVEAVNILYEKDQGELITDIMIAENISSTNIALNTYSWYVPFSGNPQQSYPTYRIKIVSTVSNNVITYSNPFKVSVIMTGIIIGEET